MDRREQGDAGLAALPAEVAATRRFLADVLRRVDPAAASADGAAGTTAAQGRAPATPRPVVALVGVPGRGRHALLAALVGRDDLPAGTTRVVHTSVTARGTVAVEVPLLEEMDLAVGPHRDDGVWDAGDAAALLVLADAGAPLDRGELAALAEAAGRVETVVFALVRTEAHRGHATVLEADRALVAEHVPRLAGTPWFPVSAALARRAEHTPDPDTARALRERSGLAPLQRALFRLVARRRRMLGEANAVRALTTALDAAATRAGTVADAARSVGTAEAGRRRRELDAARAGLRRDRHVRWRSELAAARVAASDDLAGRLRALSAGTRERIDTAGRDALAGVPAEVAGAVERIAATVVAGLGARLRVLVTTTLADLVPADELAALRIPVPREPAAPTPPPTRARGAEDRLLVVAGASGGLGLSRFALLPLLVAPAVAGAVGAALVPVSVGLGLGAAGWLARTRRLAAERARLRAWLAEALAGVRADLDRVLADALIDAEREVTLALDDALDRRARELADAAGEAEDRARREAGVRAAAARSAERTAAEARAAAEQGESLLARLAALRDR